MSPERSKASLNTLQTRCSLFLKEKNIKNIWFADCVNNQEFKNHPDDATDVVLFGSFLRRVLESGNWPFRDVRLWCLSPSVRQVLCSLFAFDEAEIGVIPRSNLFPQKNEIRSFPAQSEKWTLVFSGRLSPTKNLETFLAVGYFLQKKFFPKMRLICQGEFTDDLDPCSDRKNLGSYKKYIEDFVGSLDWISPPVFVSPEFQESWTLDYKRHHLNPVLASFSLFSAEDFGVAVAEARTQGWPVILSDWGGHRDVTGKSVIKISAHSIPEGWETYESLLIKGQFIAEQIFKRWGSDEIKDEFPFTTPKVLSVEQLYSKRQNFIQRLGHSFSDLFFGEGKIENFFTTESGKKVWATYRSSFSENYKNRRHLLIVTHDIAPDAGDVAKLVPQIMRLWQNYALEQNLEVDYLFVRDLMKRISMVRDLNCEAIVFPFFVNRLLPLVQFLINTFNIPFPVNIYFNEDQNGIHESIVQKNIREHDCFVVTNEQLLKAVPLGIHPLKIYQGLKETQKHEFFSVVELELNTECNRRCSYCPNGQGLSRGQVLMDEDLFLKIISELQELRFSGILSFHFYGEPLLHPKLAEMIRTAREFLPLAKFHLYSNGTLLDIRRFRELKRAGVDLFILTKHEGVEHFPIERRWNELTKDEKDILSIENHLKLEKTNRGGVLQLGESLKGELFCYMPSTMLVITAKGNVLPCYEDYFENLTLGNLKENSLKELWQTVAAQNLRQDLAQGKRMKYNPCKDCNNMRIIPIR